MYIARGIGGQLGTDTYEVRGLVCPSVYVQDYVYEKNQPGVRGSLASSVEIKYDCILRRCRYHDKPTIDHRISQRN